VDILQQPVPYGRQWRSQKLCVGAELSARGQRIEALVPSGVESGEGSPPQPTRESGERHELPVGSVNAFSAYSRPQNASRRKNNTCIVMYYELGY